ncbi:carboxymuconolactone decarboxylase family protein [Algibacter sp. Ld11]|uniref:carboxymuconolactone decarboxylase family protein n=1 Tax=Algibacter sp. Ld11 TaxID=649150 RepID=UPI00386E07D0
MINFQVPTKETVSPTNQAIFEQLEKKVGFLPNLYATYAHSENALKNHLDFSAVNTSLNNKEKEVVNLAVSQVNECLYCLAAHTAIGKMSGFTDEQILEIRKGQASFDNKLDALAKLAKNVTENRGKTDPAVIENFFNSGYTKENLVDTIELVGLKTISNYLHRTTGVPVDFPSAPELKLTTIS